MLTSLKEFKLSFIFIVLIVHSYAWAQPNITLIKGSEIIEDLSHCSYGESEQSLIFAAKSTSTHHQLNNEGKKIGEFSPGSILYLHPSQRGVEKGEVFVKVALVDEQTENLSHPVANNSTGFVDRSVLQDPSNWVFEIKKSEIPGVRKEDQSFLQNKLLQVLKRDEKFLGLKCCKDSQCQRYPLFSVWEKGGREAVHYFAFRPHEADFIAKMDAYPKASATAPIRKSSSGSSFTGVTTTPSASFAGAEPATASATIVNGAFEKLICTQSSSLNVRDENLSRVLFQAPRLSKVKVFQGWGTNNQSKTINGKTYQYVKGQFVVGGQEKIGWIAEDYVKFAADCPYAAPDDSPGNGTFIGGVTPEVSTQEVAISVPGSGLIFPLKKAPLRAYTSGGRQFGAGRSKGRKHAACDLRRPYKDPIVAIDDGTVLRKYYFYKGTDALEIRHSDGRVVRYGEVSQANTSGIRSGAKVKKGQQVAIVGQLSGGSSMLHFELYSGKSSGPLTQRDRKPYQRRADLVNPTSELQKWQQASL
ncbi:MAG: M23 family metallopeptidase [Bdellovibrionales bacterium]|nr:M23 family metallopeptidase [Bdellovibrionales bacterium]